MDFFITSALPTSAPVESAGPSSRPLHHVVFPDELSATPTIPASHRPSFVTFLQHVISLGIDILPPTWDDHAAARDELPARDGGTATVKQSLVNASTALLYKRFRRDVPAEYVARFGADQAESQFREMQFAAMMNEMTILAHKGLSGTYDGVVRLMGVCFEPLPPSGLQVWPILVLLKAHHGDLAASVTAQPMWRFLADESLLNLCGLLAQAIHGVHRCGK